MPIILNKGQNKQQHMFGNAYQNGHYFEVWDSKVNNDKNQLYKQLVKVIPQSNKSQFDKDVKSYVYTLEGQNAKIVLPAVDQKELSLHQKFLVLHIFLPVGTPWSMELGITDINGIKRRINFTTVQGKSEVKFFSVRYPLDNLERGNWLFLAFNLYSFIDIFKGQVYRSLDHITIGSNCRLRRIFTMREWQHWQIPKSFWLNSEIQQQFQLIQYRELSLPKISGNKSLSNEQSSPLQIDKQGSIKHSKSNLTRSEIINKPIQKSSGVSQSPGKTIIDKIEALQKQKDKITASTKSNIINESKIRNLSKIDTSPKKNDGYLNKIVESKLISDRQQEKLKPSPKKSPPALQKSFREDQALNYKPHDDSEQNFETSNQSFIQRPLKKQHQRWQNSPQLPKSNSKVLQTEPQPMATKASPNIGLKPSINRTVLTKQNSKNVIEVGQKNQELQLIYDEMVGCYYHPQTHTYYQIKQ